MIDNSDDTKNEKKEIGVAFSPSEVDKLKEDPNTTVFPVQIGSVVNAYFSAHLILAAFEKAGIFKPHLILFKDGSGQLIIPLVEQNAKLDKYDVDFICTILTAGLPEQKIEVTATLKPSINVRFLEFLILNHLRDFQNHILLENLEFSFGDKEKRQAIKNKIV